MLFDGDKMREVMMSLLSNAFKFTCSGGRVDVFVSLVEGQDSREMLEIRVADTGIGIKKKTENAFSDILSSGLSGYELLRWRR